MAAKIIRYSILIIAFIFIIINFTKLDFNNLLSGDSYTASIGLVLSLIVILLISILNISLKIKKKSKS